MSEIGLMLLLKPVMAVAIIFVVGYLPYRAVEYIRPRLKDGPIKTIFFTNMYSWSLLNRKVPSKSAGPANALEDTLNNPRV